MVQGLGPVARMKFGPGTNGRIGTVVIALAIICGIVALPLAFREPPLALVALGMAIVLALSYLGAAYWYADRHPELSAMDSVHVAKVLIDGAMRAPPGSQIDAVQATYIDVRPVPNPAAPPEPEGGHDA